MRASTDHIDEAEAVRRVIAGDADAFEILIRLHQAHVFAVVRKHVPPQNAGEVAHDVFIRAYQGIAGFSGKSSLAGWLSGIAVRACYDFWRKAYRRREIPMSQLTDDHREWIEQTLADESGDGSESRTEALEMLDWALNRLGAAERMVLELIHLEGYTHREATELLGWSAANVKVRAYRARKKVYQLISAQTKKVVRVKQDENR